MMMSDIDDGLLQEFLVESREHLETIEPDLLILETQQEGADQETINRIFRAIHTIKGASGFFGLEAIKRLSHVMENMLMAFRDGKMHPSPETIDPLLKGVDLLRSMVNHVSESEQVPYQEVYQTIELLMGQGTVAGKLSTVSSPSVEQPSKKQPKKQGTMSASSVEANTPKEDAPWYIEQPKHTHLCWANYTSEHYMQHAKEGHFFYLLSTMKDTTQTASFCDSVGTVIAKQNETILLATVIDPDLMAINLDGLATVEYLPYIEPCVANPSYRAEAAQGLVDEVTGLDISELEVFEDEVPLHEAMLQWGFGKDLVARFPDTLKSSELLQHAAEGYHLYIGIDLLPSVRKQLSSFAKVYYSDEIGDVFLSVVEYDILLKTLGVDEKHLVPQAWPKPFTVMFAEYRKKLNDKLVKVLSTNPALLGTTALTDPEFYVRQGFPEVFTENFLPDANLLRQHILIGETPYVLILASEVLGSLRPTLASIGTVLEEHKTSKGQLALLFLTVLEPMLLEAALEESVLSMQAVELPQGYQLQIESLRKQVQMQQQAKAKQHASSASAGTTQSASSAQSSVPNKAPSMKSGQVPTSVNPEVETVRVKIDLLDRLMDMVGELVLCRNQLVRSFNTLSKAQLLKGGDQTDQQKLSSLVQNMSFIATSLQDRILQMRMQTLDGLFKKFPRVVRDLSQSLQKDIVIEISGQDVELDKSVIEVLSDPLTHMIRNCCDHAIETPSEREHASKSPRGTIRLRAYHNVGRIHVEVADDGRGIDPMKVGQKALEKGLVTEEKLAAMTEQEIIQLVFLPGFSTAEKVTDVSGRGVGMDVVRSKIEKVGGSVSIHSEVGVGTTFTIKIPLTLA
ncbi:MAG: ATP-binding protein, partial [Vampirovibrionales bacterium]